MSSTRPLGVVRLCPRWTVFALIAIGCMKTPTPSRTRHARLRAVCQSPARAHWALVFAACDLQKASTRTPSAAAHDCCSLTRSLSRLPRALRAPEQLLNSAPCVVCPASAATIARAFPNLLLSARPPPRPRLAVSRPVLHSPLTPAREYPCRTAPALLSLLSIDTNHLHHRHYYFS